MGGGDRPEVELDAVGRASFGEDRILVEKKGDLIEVAHCTGLEARHADLDASLLRRHQAKSALTACGRLGCL